MPLYPDDEASSSRAVLHPFATSARSAARIRGAGRGLARHRRPGLHKGRSRGCDERRPGHAMGLLSSAAGRFDRPHRQRRTRRTPEQHWALALNYRSGSRPRSTRPLRRRRLLRARLYRTPPPDGSRCRPADPFPWQRAPAEDLLTWLEVGPLPGRDHYLRRVPLLARPARRSPADRRGIAATRASRSRSALSPTRRGRFRCGGRALPSPAPPIGRLPAMSNREFSRDNLCFVCGRRTPAGSA